MNLRLAIAVIAVSAFGGGGAASDVHRCSIVPYSDSRDSGRTVLLGVARAGTTSAGLGIGLAPGHWGGGLLRRTKAQEIHVRRIGGFASDSLSRYFRVSADTSVWIVPWDYGANCKPVRWSAPGPWTPIDSVGVFTVRLRPQDSWLRGRPTFDASRADIEPYPHGRFFREGYRSTDVIARGGGLSATEFFEFYLMLPTESPYRRYSPDAHARLRAWASANPHLADKFPVNHVLAAWAHAERRSP